MRKMIYLLFLIVFAVNNNAFGGNTQSPEAKKELKLPEANWVTDSVSKLEAQKELLLQKPKKDSTTLAKIATLDSAIMALKQTKPAENTVCCNDDTQSNILSIAILLFGLIIMLAILIFQKKKAPETNYHPFKLIGLMFIGTVSVFLIPAGFSNNQITPIIGLLGTLAGYLVGSSNNAANQPKPADPAHADNKDVKVS